MTTKNLAQSKSKKYKVQPQHIGVFGVLVVVFFILFQFVVIPWGAMEFVVSLFKPAGDKMDKIGFVKFSGNVYASTSPQKEKELGKGSVEIAKDLINKEYIFDFSFTERNEPQHGYVKGAFEWYAKSEVLGENAIILEPWIGFTILALVFGIVCAVICTIFMPSGIGFIALLFDRQIDNTKIKIRLQTDFSEDIVDLLTMPDDKLRLKEPAEVEGYFRTIWDRIMTDTEGRKANIRFEQYYNRDVDLVAFRKEMDAKIKEYFSDFVVKEIEDTRGGLEWHSNHLLIFKGMRLYMAHHFTEKYSNNVTGMAYGGAAVLIVAVGIRGLKFIPATKPSFILLSITLEFSMLLLMAITLIYNEEEERMDKMLKKMEDANRNQLDVLRDSKQDMHMLANALVGQTSDIIKQRVEKAISEFMTSDDKVKGEIARQIGDKVLHGLRGAFNEQK